MELRSLLKLPVRPERERNRMRSAFTTILFGLGAGLLSSGCSSGGDSLYNPQGVPSRYQEGKEGNPETYEQSGDRLYIKDSTGKSWDVTHAQKYGLQPSEFQFGLGPYAIPPLMNPQMLSPGNPDYPSEEEEFIVLGTSLNGFTRAYPINVMSRHEVANEQFGEAHVAVAY